MRPSLAIKTLFRSPGKTIITFLLLAALTFSLFLQVAEYTATKREFEKNIGMYVGTGYVEKEEAGYAGFGKLAYPYYIATDPRIDTAGWDLPDLSGFDYPSLTGAEIAEVSGLTGVSSTYRRFMTAGRGEYPRLRDDDALWDNNSLVVIEGTLQEPCLVVSHPNPYYAYPYEQAFALADAKLLAGDMDMDYYKEMGSICWQRTYGNLKSHFDPEYVEQWFPPGSVNDGELYISAVPWNADDVPFMEEDWVPSVSKDDMNMYNTGDAAIGYKIGNVILKNYSYGLDAQDTWSPGNRYVFVLRCSHEPSDLQAISLNLYDWLSDHFCPAVWDITDAPENYLELEEYAPLKKLMEIIESDLNTLDVVYADDMDAIKLVHDGKMTLTEGRWLTPEDTANGAKVCMLDEKFAQTYGLKVGDSLPLELGDTLFEQFYNHGAVAGTVERYADNWTDAEFEIVGLYSTVGGAFAASKEPNWSYSVNTVFVPLSSLPETADTANWELAPGEFTFRVDNAWDIEAFLEKSAPQIEAMGLSLIFDDGGWMEACPPYVETQRVALLRIELLAGVTVMATAFAVYLFISRKRKDYAIMRALGTPKRQSGAALLLPLLVLAVVSVAVGLAAAMLYIGSMGKMGCPPLGLALLCGAAELAIALLLALGMLRSLRRQSVLVLLQGGSNTRKAVQPAPQGAETVTLAVNAAAPIVEAGPRPVQAPLRRKPRPLRFVLRYIFRHIRRSAVKSLLAVLVAALMLSAVAQLGYMRSVYERLRTDTVVTARFNQSLILPKLKNLEADGLVAELYYERNLDGVIVLEYGETREIHIALTNDIETYADRDCEISYAPGYGPEDMGVTGKYAVLGRTLMEESGIALGDRVRLCKLEDTDLFFQTEGRRLRVEHPEHFKDDDRSSLWAAWPEYMEQELNKLCDCLTVIGCVSTGDSSYDSMVFSPGLETTKKFMTDNLLDHVVFRVPDNSRARELKQRGEDMTGHRGGAFSIDIEKLESVERTAALLETLYPIVVALTLLIGAFLCVLIIMQTVKDAAIMRILGTTKAMTQAMLAVEQVLLAVLGLAIGLGVMAAVHRTDFDAIAGQVLRFGGAYLAIAAAASAVSAAITTRKNILALLQTKE